MVKNQQESKTKKIKHLNREKSRMKKKTDHFYLLIFLVEIFHPLLKPSLLLLIFSCLQRQPLSFTKIFNLNQ